MCGFLAICMKTQFIMRNLEMQFFFDLEPSSKSEHHVAQRIGRKNLFFSAKIPKCQKFLQISWNLDYRFFIKRNDEPRMPQPISRVLHPLFASLNLSLPLLSNFRFSLCTPSSGTSNDISSTSMKPHECMSFQGWVTLGFHFIIGWMTGWHNCWCTTALDECWYVKLLYTTECELLFWSKQCCDQGENKCNKGILGRGEYQGIRE